MSSPAAVAAPAAGIGALDQPVWAASAAAVLTATGTPEGGLTEAEARGRLATQGPNAIPAPKGKPAWLRFLAHFDDVLVYVLLVAAVLKVASGDWVDFTVIVVVILANAVIGYVQEGRAADALASLSKMVSLDAQVERDGTWGVIDATDLVVGDIVRLRSGDRVPADLRLLDTSNLAIDEAALTGESVASDKSPRPVSADAGVGDRSDMAFSGTIVTAGSGTGVVVGTGATTEIGKISQLVSEQEAIDTPLTKQINRLGKQISMLILVLAIVMLLVGRLVHGFSGEDLISAAIAFAVAAVPEGLPALITITLALGVQQMANRNAITRRMASVETLGSVTSICSDKTGTLTKNEMTVRTVVTAAGQYDVAGSGYEPAGSLTVAGSGQPVALASHGDLAEFVVAAGAASDSHVQEVDGHWRAVGAPTEAALDVLVAKAGLGADVAALTRLAQVPFDSEHKLSAALDERPDGALVANVLGAPDRLLDRATWQLSATGERVPLERGFWENAIDELSSRGLRVLAAADLPVTGVDSLELADLDGLTFLGLAGIVDPPREEVRDAIAEAHKAGIRVKMITGDHAGTAVAISRELGIADGDGAVGVLTGAELEEMNQDELRQAAPGIDVYARTSPEHKLRIVRALQSNNEVVAMTGDGVNDAPSITRADVGVAMGIKGTEATKEAADIVLADDNFATIERAIEEGRRIYDNIRKSVVFLLPTNGAQSLVIFVAVIFGWTLPLAPVQILWVNLATAVTLSLALAGDPAEPGIMERSPRSPSEQILSRRTLTLVLIASLLIGGVTLFAFWYERELGQPVAVAQTTAVTMLALAQLAFLFNCRFLSTSSLTPRVLRGNRAIWISSGLLIALQLVFVYAPFMHNWFGSASLGIQQWGLTIVLAVVVFLAVEVAKAAARRVPEPRFARPRRSRE